MRAFFGIGLMVLSSCTARSQSTGTVSVREAAVTIMGQIQIADYAGDRSALRRLHDDFVALRPPQHDSYLASRIEYWKGFALWRRALNGFSAGIDQTELEGDLSLAVRHFEEAFKYDEGLIDANVGIISCLQNLAHLKRDDPAVRQQLVSRFVPLLRQSLAAAPDNPRLLWVLGAGQWYNPPERSGGQALAVATYQRGLKLAREQRGVLRKPLDPAWGEPELLMNLALASLNGTPSNPRSAEEYASQALALVPHWRYVRDVLLPQIQQRRNVNLHESRPRVQLNPDLAHISIFPPEHWNIRLLALRTD